MVEVFGEHSPLSSDHLRGNFTAFEAKHGRSDKLHEELSPAEAARMREELRAAVPQLMAEAQVQTDRMSLQDIAVIQRSISAGATYALREVANRTPKHPLGEGVSPKHWWHRWGSLLWKHTYAHTRDDHEVMTRLLPLVHQAFPPDRQEFTRLWFSTEEGMMFAQGVARWADQAYPLVQLAGHRYAAALMATRPPKGVDIRPPWKAFVIELPQGMLHTDNQSGELGALTHILVNTSQLYLRAEDYGDPTKLVPSWSFTAMGYHGIELHRWRKTLDNLLDDGDFDDSDDPFNFPSALEMGLTEQDTRTMQLLTRVVLNTCLVMSDPESVRPIGGSSKSRRKRGNRRNKDEPVFRTFRVGKPIKLDCRPAVESFLSGDRKRQLSVQFLVRGHWRNQACGPGLSERRMTWIEPHWKGPEEAPINRRSHIVGSEDRGSAADA